MKKIFSLLLVTILALSFSGLQEAHATSNSAYIPSGINYIEPANMDFDGTCISTQDYIAVLSNTTYTLSFPEIVGPDVLSIFGVDSDYADYESPSLNGDYLTYTFTTTANETSISIEICGGGTGQYWDYYQVDDFQLEVGSVRTAFEVYNPPVVDVTPPLINGATGLVFSNVSNPTSVTTIKNSLTATDGVDGDITASIYVKSDLFTGNETTLGDYLVQFAAVDSAGNETVIDITFRVVDVDIPIISLVGSSTIYVEFGNTYSEPGATVSDNYDSLSAVITGSVNNSALGTYTLYYNATDSSGNPAAQITRTVIVRDTTSPVQSLVGSSTIYVEFGSSYSELGSTVTDNYDSGLTSTISGTVNVSSLGTYTVYYNVTDSNGNVASQITRTVIVRDTTSANIIGDTSVSLFTSGSTLIATILEDYTYNDLHDASGALTVEVINDTYTGNETTSGVYTFDIRVTDTSGNIATQTITVTVADDDFPIFNTTADIYSNEYADSLTQAEIRALFGK